MGERARLLGLDSCAKLGKPHGGSVVKRLTLDYNQHQWIVSESCSRPGLPKNYERGKIDVCKSPLPAKPNESGETRR
jgi:hypothetical protein